jgi:hypothetical protein
VAAIRAEDGAEIGTLRKENAELRDRINKQWEMEDELRSRYADKQVDIEKTKVVGRILGTLGEAGVAQMFPKGGAGHQNVRQQLAERFLDSFTKDQANAVLPMLNQEQQVLLASFLRLGAEAQEVANGAQSSGHDTAAAAVRANGESTAAATANGKSAD